MRKLMAACMMVFLTAAMADELEVGRRIYNEGVLPSGALLVGNRQGGEKFTGQAAACVSCHRRSGLGAVEGTLLVPPIAGSFLFDHDHHNLVNMDQRNRKSFNQAHQPYTDSTFARAVQAGVNSEGREMNAVMPRFELNDSELHALSVYLRQLSSVDSPGANSDRIRFATVIAPDVEPERREAMLAVLKAAVMQKNASTVSSRQYGGRRHMVTAAEMVLGTERKWELDVWQLTGSPETWGAQLADFYQKKPVFALLSGASGGTWKPVHEFAQSNGIPCWFPSVVMPETDNSFYTLYFSRGMGLEADLLAMYLKDKKHVKKLIQIVGKDPAAMQAARQFASRLEADGVKVVDRTGNLRAALSGTAEDAVMLWLTPGELTELKKIPAVAGDVYLSAHYSGSQPLPSKWRKRAHLAYGYELPEKRAAGLSTFHSWLKLHKLPLVDEVLQSEVYFSVNFLSDVVVEMLNNQQRDYLIERAEYTLSLRQGVLAEREGRDRAALGRLVDIAMRNPGRVQMDSTANLAGMASQSGRDGFIGGTTIYPRLSLAIGQRFASKGGYVVKFNDKGALVAETDLIVP